MIRDRDQLNDFGKPVFAAGITPVGPVGEGPVGVGVPIALGEQQVCSGDVILGDADGIVVVPQAKLASATQILAEIADREANLETQAKAGGTVPEQWAALRATAILTELT